MTTRSRKAAAGPVRETVGSDAVDDQEAPETTDGAGTTPAPVASFSALEAALKAADDRPVKSVKVTEWPGQPVIYLRGITGIERDEMEIAMSRMLGGTQYIFFDNSGAQLVARAMCTPDGKRLIPHEKLPETIKTIGGLPAGGLLRLNKVAQTLSGLSDRSIDELVEDLKDDPSASSGTD